MVVVPAVAVPEADELPSGIEAVRGLEGQEVVSLVSDGDEVGVASELMMLSEC